MDPELLLLVWYLAIGVLIFLATSRQNSRVAALFGYLATASIIGAVVYLIRHNQENQIGQPAHHLLVFAMLAGFGYILGEAHAKNRLRPP